MVRKRAIVTDNCDWHLRRANIAVKWLILSVQIYGYQIFCLNRVFSFISQKILNHVHNTFFGKNELPLRNSEPQWSWPSLTEVLEG